MKGIVDRFVKLYDPAFLHQPSEANKTGSGFPWSSIEGLARAMDLSGLAAQSSGDWFYGQGVSKLFIEEMIEAATLVNYGQEIYSIHGVGGGVSLAASGAVGIKGGNSLIFEELIGKCESLKLRLGIHGEVTGLARFKTVDAAIEAGKLTEEEAKARGYSAQDSSGLDYTTKWWLGTKSGFGDLYDAVFIATPWRSSGIVLLNTHATIPAYDFVHLHVTIVVTSAKHPNPAYFGRGKGDDIPTSILTSHVSLRKEEEKRRKDELKRRRGKAPLKGTKWWPGGGKEEKRGPKLEVRLAPLR